MHGTFKTIEAKADPLTLESLIAWLEKQPTDLSYVWADCNGGCLIGLYGIAHGISWKTMIKSDIGNTSPYDRLTRGGVAYKYPRTFGGALERARASLSS